MDAWVPRDEIEHQVGSNLSSGGFFSKESPRSVFRINQQTLAGLKYHAEQVLWPTRKLHPLSSDIHSKASELLVSKTNDSRVISFSQTVELCSRTVALRSGISGSS